MNLSDLYPLIFAVPVAALIGGALLGYSLTNRILSKGLYTKENAGNLLMNGKPEQWNEVRSGLSEWNPRLPSAEFSGLILVGVNFRRAFLDGSAFVGATLDDADFSEASLRNVDFTNASLQGARFDKADLTGARLKGARLKDVSFSDARLKDTDIDLSAVEGEPSPPTVEQISKEMLLKNPSLLSTLSPSDFETLVASVLDDLGYEVRRAKPPLDVGFDMIALLKKEPFGELTYLVECKSYRAHRPVGISTVRALWALKEMQNATGALLVTTSYFAKQAIDFAASVEGLELIGPEQLLNQWSSPN